MRSHEERVAAVKRRIAQAEQEKRLRRSRMAAVCSVAACLILIVGLSVVMPGIVSGMAGGDYAGGGMAASMFGDSAVIGYIVIGLIAFLLGVCVTILCFRLRKFQRENRKEEPDARDHR